MAVRFDWEYIDSWVCVCVYVLSTHIYRLIDWLDERHLSQFWGRDDPRCSWVLRCVPEVPRLCPCGCSGVSLPGNCLGGLVWWDPSSLTPSPSLAVLVRPARHNNSLLPCHENNGRHLLRLASTTRNLSHLATSPPPRLHLKAHAVSTSNSTSPMHKSPLPAQPDIGTPPTCRGSAGPPGPRTRASSTRCVPPR